MRAVAKNYNFLSPEIRQSSIKAILIFLICNVLYIFILAPTEIPDAFLSATVGKAAVFFLNLTSSASWQYIYFDHGAYVLTGGVPLVKVMHACNALELFVLYIGFFFCFPASSKRIIVFAVIGCILIFTTNVLRIAGVAWLHYVHSSWVNFNHKVVFKAAIYGLILLLWHLYAKKKSGQVG